MLHEMVRTEPRANGGVMLAVQIYQAGDVPDSLLCQALSFMRIEWTFAFSGTDRLKKESWPLEFHPVHFLISEQDILISYAELWHFPLTHAQDTFQVCGFGDVFTYPAFRHEGHGQHVVAAAAQHIDASEADVAILFCEPSLAAFYGRSGWEAMPEAVTRVGTLETYTAHDALRMMRFISEKGKRARSVFAQQPLYLSWAF